jgi:hypothetical protein
LHKEHISTQSKLRVHVNIIDTTVNKLKGWFKHHLLIPCINETKQNKKPKT